MDDMEYTENLGMNLFVYGTLMWPEVLESVIGRRLAGTAATLHGYERRRIMNEHYPALVPAEGGQVAGFIFSGLTKTDVEHLDRFEGVEYDRVRICVEDRDAHVYIISEAYRHIVEEVVWQPEQMLPEHLSAFCEEYKGWHEMGRS